MGDKSTIPGGGEIDDVNRRLQHRIIRDMNIGAVLHKSGIQQRKNVPVGLNARREVLFNQVPIPGKGISQIADHDTWRQIAHR